MSSYGPTVREVATSFHSQAAGFSRPPGEMDLSRHRFAHLRDLERFCATVPELHVSNSSRILSEFDFAARVFLGSPHPTDIHEMKVCAQELQFLLKGALRAADKKFHTFKQPDIDDVFRRSLLAVIYSGIHLAPIRKALTNLSASSIEAQAEVKKDLKEFLCHFIPKLQDVDFGRFELKKAA